MNKYANPFLIKICRELWQKFPKFIIICEAWIGHGFENRDVVVVKSGPIPRIYQLPIALSAIFGQQLKKDGTIIKCEKKNVNQFKV